MVATPAAALPRAVPPLTNLRRVYGPPGCGKTTWLRKAIRNAVWEQHYLPEQIMVLSYSRAAFREFKSKLQEGGLEIPDENLGTLHSMGYRALMQPALAIDSHGVNLWNGAGLGPRLTARVKGGKSPGADIAVDPYGDGSDGDPVERGDRLLNEITSFRNRLIPETQWTPEQREFHTAWQAFKKEHDLVDFSDMIERSIMDTPFAPGNPSLIYVDEAQDLNPLQHLLIRYWGWSAEQVVLIGDDDQTIYSFQGADANSFLSGDAVEEIVLEQSYRVPQLVQGYAQAIINRVVGKRKDKTYRPRDVLGSVRQVDGWERAYREGLERIAEGKTVMYMASARYMLEDCTRLLRAEGWPFHNPYAPHRKEFNPLGQPATGQVAGWQRIAAFLKRDWKGSDVGLWVKHLSVRGTFIQGAAGRTRLEKLNKDDRFNPEHPAWEEITEEAAERILARDLSWYADHLLSTATSGMRYAITVAQYHGEAALYQLPKIMVGTIHSFKGGEADVVYVHPTLSSKAAIECQSQEGQDNIHRLFYVAVTRSKWELVLLDHDPSLGPMGYRWPSAREIEVEV